MKTIKLLINLSSLLLCSYTFGYSAEGHYYQPEDLTPFIYNDDIQTFKSSAPPAPTDAELVARIRRYLTEDLFFSDVVNTFDIRARDGYITIIGNVRTQIEKNNIIIGILQVDGVKSLNTDRLYINPNAREGFIRQN